MQKIFRRSAGALVLVLVAIQFVRPARTNPATDKFRTLASRHPMPGETAAVLERGCRDCHSNDTRWPWYSQVAPVSWFVIDHVNHGRRHFNYSEWTRYDSEEARRILSDACRMVREHAMPLSSYTWMHPTARLTPPDIEALCSWTRNVTGR